MHTKCTEIMFIYGGEYLAENIHSYIGDHFHSFEQCNLNVLLEKSLPSWGKVFVMQEKNPIYGSKTISVAGIRRKIAWNFWKFVCCVHCVGSMFAFFRVIFSQSFGYQLHFTAVPIINVSNKWIFGKSLCEHFETH